MSFFILARAAAPKAPFWSRSYAVRPLPRPRDPVSTSKTARVTELAPGLTFIEREPQTAPSPYSRTTAPASPLLLPQSSTSSTPSSLSLSSSLSTSHSQRLKYARLPPVLGSGPPTKRYHLTEKDASHMRSLRAADPEKHTVQSLARQFKCAKAFVQINAPLSKEWRNKLEGDIIEQRAGWGARKRLQREVRKKRRELW